jgi:hypothetical protein
MAGWKVALTQIVLLEPVLESLEEDRRDPEWLEAMTRSLLRKHGRHEIDGKQMSDGQCKLYEKLQYKEDVVRLGVLLGGSKEEAIVYHYALGAKSSRAKKSK